LTGKLAELDEFFRKCATHDLTDKSVNGQNCRKSALLSQMLIRHKVLIASKQSAEGVFDDLLITYLSLFKEVASLVFDLGPFLVYCKGTASSDKLV
jgi:hypothetical protein